MTILFLHLTQKNDPLHQVTDQTDPKQKGQAINLSFGTVSGEDPKDFSNLMFSKLVISIIKEDWSALTSLPFFQLSEF